ncbi:MAG: hypothetical protein LBR70_00675 [Lactobacillaceae bacterium]|jgi:hypothetical protein|nr:hypothetical protein [Lactobacillaceae bacterium]
MTQAAFINVRRSFTSSKTFAYGIVLPLCFWGAITVLSIGYLGLTLLIGIIFFGVMGAISEIAEKKWLTNTCLTLLYTWMVGLYVAIFAGMAYLPCHWLSPPESSAPAIGAVAGFSLGVITAVMLIRMCIRAKKDPKEAGED